jgi:hypothetical protein
MQFEGKTPKRREAPLNLSARAILLLSNGKMKVFLDNARTAVSNLIISLINALNQSVIMHVVELNGMLPGQRVS